MDRSKRVSLNDPAFAGRLRYTHRSSAYVQRPSYETPATIINDMLAPAKQAAVQTTSAPKPVPGPLHVVQRPVQPQMVDVAPPAPVVNHQLQVSVQPAPQRPHPVSHSPKRLEKSRVLRRHAVKRPKPIQAQAAASAQELPARSKRPFLLYAMAAAVFVIGVTVSLNGLRANRQVAAQAKHLSGSSTDASDDNGGHPSTSKPADADVKNYVVAPNLPRYIDIPKLTVHARVLSMGVTSKNQLKAPGNVYDAGWYNASAQPGQPGAMLVDGHISSWSTKGVFYGLNKLVAGDPITITRGDGKTFTYTVVKTTVVYADSVDMGSLMVSQNTGKPGLNLISCSGDVVPGTNEFDKRIIVYAVQS